MLIALAAKRQCFFKHRLFQAARLGNAGRYLLVQNFVKSGHGRHDCRMYFGHVGGKTFDAFCIIDLGTDGDREELSCGMFIGMAERQEGQEHLALQTHIPKGIICTHAVMQDRTVMQHHAFRRAPGAGGVDDAGGILTAELFRHFGDVFVACLPCFQHVGHMQDLGATGRGWHVFHNDDEFDMFKAFGAG